MSAAGTSRLPMLAGMATGFKSVARYFRGVLGADAYDNYLEHYRRLGHQHAPLTEREFWRDQTDRQDANPQGRCC